MSQQKINTIPYCYKNTGGALFIYEIQKERQKSLRDRLPVYRALTVFTTSRDPKLLKTSQNPRRLTTSDIRSRHDPSLDSSLIALRY